MANSSLKINFKPMILFDIMAHLANIFIEDMQGEKI